jgi:hypothetical protein
MNEQAAWMLAYVGASGMQRSERKRIADEAVIDFRARWAKDSATALCEQSTVRRICGWLRDRDFGAWAGVIETEFLK